MASTGTGKTIANAKIINAMNNNKKGLRYILAVGLRTLVLQTGTAYLEKPISFKKEDVSVCIGSFPYRAINDMDGAVEEYLKEKARKEEDTRQKAQQKKLNEITKKEQEEYDEYLRLKAKFENS